MADSLIEVRHLSKTYQTKSGLNEAVKDVSFAIEKGTTMGLIGESGCGKTTLGRIILCLEKATHGEVIYNGQNLMKLKKESLRKLRPEIQMIFQDPYQSLSPRMTIGEIIWEGVRTHKIVERSEEKEYLFKIMEDCGLQKNMYLRYPHEFSGGQRQRISIARALALKPKFIIADEPVTALDPSVQGQIMNLLMDLQKEYQLTYLLISHDLSVVGHMASTLGIMVNGGLVAFGDSRTILNEPDYAYTKVELNV